MFLCQQPEIQWIMDNKGIKAARMCATLLPKCGDWEEVNGWNIDIPDGKPDPEEPVLPEVQTFTACILSHT